MRNFKVGDKVGYSRRFLKSTGMMTGPIPRAKGTIVDINPKFGSSGLATIDWDNEDVPKRVMCANLAIVGSVDYVD
jgi:hypothetical protein